MTSKASSRPPESEHSIDSLSAATEDEVAEGVTLSVTGPTVREGVESKDGDVATSATVEPTKEDRSNDASGSSPEYALGSDLDHDVPHRDLRVEANVPLTLDIGETARIGTGQLRISGAESPLLDLMLLSPPVHGTLLRDGFALTGGDAFDARGHRRGTNCLSSRRRGQRGRRWFHVRQSRWRTTGERLSFWCGRGDGAPRLVGGGDLQGVQEGIAVAVLLNEPADDPTVWWSLALRGVWERSTDEGRTWQPFGQAASNQALLLDPADRLRFAPATLCRQWFD